MKFLRTQTIMTKFTATIGALTLLGVIVVAFNAEVADALQCGDWATSYSYYEDHPTFGCNYQNRVGGRNPMCAGGYITWGQVTSCVQQEQCPCFCNG